MECGWEWELRVSLGNCGPGSIYCQGDQLPRWAVNNEQGPISIWRPSFSSMGIPMLKIRRSRDSLIFNMVIPILVGQHLYIEMAPSSLWRLCNPIPEQSAVFYVGFYVGFILMAWCKTAVSHKKWRYCSLALSYHYVISGLHMEGSSTMDLDQHCLR